MSYPRPELTSWSWQASVYSVLPSLSIKNKPISPELACFGELDMGFLPFSPAISHFGSIHSFTDECSMQIWTGGCGRMFLTLRCHHDPFLILVGGKGLLIFNKGLWKVRNLWTLTNPNVYILWFYICIPVINFNLWIRHSKRLTSITNNGTVLTI